MTQNIQTIIRKIFDDYDEKNGAQQKIDYTDRASKIVDTWTKEMNAHGLTTELICELHRIVCDYADIAINDEQGNIIGYTKAGEYRTHPSSRNSELHKGSRTLFQQPQVIASMMEQLVSIMNSVLATQSSKELMIENIVAFILEFVNIHPFTNQNGRVAQVIMELLAYHAGLEAFNISNVAKRDKASITAAAEKTIIEQNVNLFLEAIQKINQNAGVDCKELLS